MKGLELSRQFYNQYGKPMLENDFPEILGLISVGLIGSGSECFGFDDEVSTDHDFEPGFCIFIPGEDRLDRKTAFSLERAYAKLPKEFMGFTRSMLSPVGGARHGVLRLDEFLNEKIGVPDGRLTDIDWLRVPEQALAECTNGEIFFDGSGVLTEIRNNLEYYPEDIRLKKLTGNLLIMAQSGQYNYQRCIKHGETAAAQLAVNEFVGSAMSVIFLLNKKYKPYYKWSFRALRNLEKLSLDAEIMEYLLTSSNDGDSAEEKYYSMEGIASDVIDELQTQNLTDAICSDLEKHAYSVNDKIASSEIRNLHILAAV